MPRVTIEYTKEEVIIIIIIYLRISHHFIDLYLLIYYINLLLINLLI